MSAEYAWREGTRISGVSAGAAYEELGRIRGKHGGVVQSEDVVKESRRKSSALHPYIWEHDDATAAHLHRVQRAEYLIRCLVVKHDNQKAGDTVVRAFVNVTPDGGQGFSSVEDVRVDPFMRKRLIDSYLRRLESLKRELENFEEFAGIAEAISAAKERLRAA